MFGDEPVSEIEPGRYLIDARASPDAIASAVELADTVQFGEPLPERSLRALVNALREKPATELYVYGHYGLRVDEDLRFLDGCEGIERLALGLDGLTGLAGVARFTGLTSLVIYGAPVKLDIQPLRSLTGLEYLTLPGPVKSPQVLGELGGTRILSMPAAQPLLEAIKGHPALERLTLNFGAGSALAPLATLPRLRDLEIWQIKKLSTPDLQPLGAIPNLEALALGAARNVEALEFLAQRAATLRYLHLEKIPMLKSLAPIAALERLRACALFESRPADRSLKPLTRLDELRDLVISDAYPPAEVDQVVAALPTARIQIRARETKEPPRLSWRCLFEYADSDRQ